MFPRLLAAASIALICAATCSAAEITLVGNVLNNTHTGDKKKDVYIYALDGPPDIHAEVAKIFAEIPEKGLDADTAVKIQNEFTDQLKYTITGPMADKLRASVEYGSKMLSLTGAVDEHDGQKFLLVTKSEDGRYTYPARLLAEDKPLLPSDKPPIELKIDQTQSIKCIYIPAGKFLMGEPYYQYQHWEEDPPHIVTLTRPYYIGETDITQEQFEAVMGNNPSELKDPKFPVTNLYADQMLKFCLKLSRTTGKTVRLPTAAEWEYAARAGASNPTFTEKHARLNSSAGPGYTARPLPVKSRDPNGWGLYDLCAGSWELVSDGTSQIDRQPTTDPVHIPDADKPDANGLPPADHMGKGNQNYPISEIEFLHPGSAKMLRFRVVLPIDAGN